MPVTCLAETDCSDIEYECAMLWLAAAYAYAKSLAFTGERYHRALDIVEGLERYTGTMILGALLPY